MKTWIAIEPDSAGGQHFVGYAQADQAFEGRFELVGERNGAGGTSKVHQGGSIHAIGGQPVRLSQISFGDIAQGQSYSLHLSVYHGDELVGSADLGQ